MSPPAGREAPPAIGEEKEETRPKVLLVDDAATVRDSVKPVLERAGFAVVLAVDGEDALRKVAACEPDLVIRDILMPKVDGREVLRRLRQAGNWVHVIVLTQVTGVGERVMALEEGADDPPRPPPCCARRPRRSRRSPPLPLPPPSAPTPASAARSAGPALTST